MLSFLKFLKLFTKFTKQTEGEKIRHLLTEIGDQELSAAAEIQKSKVHEHPRETATQLIPLLESASQRYIKALEQKKPLWKRLLSGLHSVVDVEAAARQLEPVCDLHNRLLQIQLMLGNLYMELGSIAGVEKSVETMNNQFEAWKHCERRRIMWASYRRGHDHNNRGIQVEDPVKQLEMEEKELVPAIELFEEQRDLLTSWLTSNRPNALT